MKEGKLSIKVYNIIYSMGAIFIALYIFFPLFSFRPYFAIIAVGLFSIVLVGYRKWSITIGFREILYFFILIYAFMITEFNFSNTRWGIEGRSIFIWFVLSFFILIIVEKTGYDGTQLLSIFACFSLVFMFATYLQFFNIGMLSTFINRYLSAGGYIAEYRQAEFWGAYYGLASTNFENAFFISIACAFCCSIFLTSVKIWKKIVLYTLSLGAIFLSGKRSLVLANVMALLFCLVLVGYFKLTRKQILRTFLMLVLVGTLLWILDERTKMITNIILRFETSTSLLNGREDIYNTTWLAAQDNLIFGHGLGSIYYLFNQGAHNIYIQLLYELGFIGLLLFLIFFFCNLNRGVWTVKNAKVDADQRIAVLCLYIQLIFLIYGMSGNPLFYNSSLLIYFISVAVSCILWRKLRK